MNKINSGIVWRPKVLGRSRLTERAWAYAVEAPFDLDPSIGQLIGVEVSLDGGTFKIRGSVPQMPPKLIQSGQALELLVVPTTGEENTAQ
jgi:hypothetical protein